MFPEFLRQLHPNLAALGIAASSISVVTNSLRLYNAKETNNEKRRYDAYKRACY
jgi:cation transport ATPase